MNENNSWSWIGIFLTIALPLLCLAYLSRRDKYSVPTSISFTCRLTNFMLWPYQKWKLHKAFKALNYEKMKRIAVKKMGYDNFGDLQFEEYYKHTIDLVNKNKYSPIGHIAASQFFQSNLIAKLRINQELEKPAIKEFCEVNPVRQPVFVLGMPRTGTTFLHRLLSLDPAARAPLTYELQDPVPRYRDDPILDKQKRIKYCQKEIDMLNYYMPEMSQVHEMGADIPEECMVAMSRDIPLLFTTFHILLVDDEAYNWSAMGAYKNYAKSLQLLQYDVERRGGKRSRWVLKCPLHIAGMSEMIEVFPDAKIVWTHRDLNEAIPSLASLIRAGQSFVEGSQSINLKKLGAGTLRYAEYMLSRGHNFFENKSANSSYAQAHVHYTDMMTDPIETIKKLYQELNFDFTDEYESILVEHISKDKEKRKAQSLMKGKKKGTKLHNYSLEEYGLEEEEVEKCLGWYSKKYKVQVK